MLRAKLSESAIILFCPFVNFSMRTLPALISTLNIHMIRYIVFNIVSVPLPVLSLFPFTKNMKTCTARIIGLSAMAMSFGTAGAFVSPQSHPFGGARSLDTFKKVPSPAARLGSSSMRKFHLPQTNLLQLSFLQRGISSLPNLSFEKLNFFIP